MTSVEIPFAPLRLALMPLRGDLQSGFGYRVSGFGFISCAGRVNSRQRKAKSADADSMPVPSKRGLCICWERAAVSFLSELVASLKERDGGTFPTKPNPNHRKSDRNTALTRYSESADQCPSSRKAPSAWIRDSASGSNCHCTGVSEATF